MIKLIKELRVYYRKIKKFTGVGRIFCALYIEDNKFAVYDLLDLRHTIIKIDTDVSITKVTLEHLTPTICREPYDNLFYSDTVDNPFAIELKELAIIPMEDITKRCSWGFVSLYNFKSNRDSTLKREHLEYILSLNEEIYSIILASKLRMKLNQPYCGRVELEHKLDRAIQFFSSVVHDMRTPINAVMGFLELLEQRVSSKDKEYVVASYRSAEMVASLINDVLDFSKIEAGKMELDIHYFSPIDEFKNIAYQFYKIAYDKGVEFCIYFDINMPFAIRSDPYRLKQIINNFLSNAIKFTPEGKIVHMEVSYSSKYDTLRIDIQDEGIGMTREEMSRLFKPFQQANNQISGKFGGTGLGLVISKKLADMLEGHIEVKSQKGKGSTFSLTIPCNTIPGTPKTIECESISDLPKVYFVNDSKSYTRHMYNISRYLKEFGIAYRFISINRIFDKKDENAIFIFDEKEYNINDYKDIFETFRDRLIFIISNIIFEVSEIAETNILYRPIFPAKLLSMILDISKGKIKDSSKMDKALKNLNILIADDNRINLKLLEELLKLQHTTPFTATNADEVLKIIRDDSNEIDMIFIDEIMNDTRGSDAIKEIRKIDKYKTIPIYSLTGSNDKYTIDLIRDSGATDVLFKPLKNRVVEELINRYRNQLN